jgi:hypothetical protein
MLISIGAVAQEKKVTWDYPVKPGMEQWERFESMDAMFQACQIPDDILKKLDTESLVRICYDFPGFMGLIFYNSPQAGFEVFYARLNGLRELMSREDVGRCMLKKYSSMSSADFNPLWKLEEKGRYAFKYQYFETLLAQPQVVRSLSTEDRKLLLRESVRKFDEKLALPDVFGGNTFSVNAWIMANNLKHERKLMIKSVDQSAVDESLKSGSLSLYGYDSEDIYIQTKKYINE